LLLSVRTLACLLAVELADLPHAASTKSIDVLADSEERAMPDNKTTADRLAAYSDAVFAVIVTIMVLELKPPDQPAFSALRSLWPTAASYALSYLFIAIIWINHH
jgi:hypothetical protein